VRRLNVARLTSIALAVAVVAAAHLGQPARLGDDHRTPEHIAVAATSGGLRLSTTAAPPAPGVRHNGARNVAPAGSVGALLRPDRTHAGITRD
jgi:hypothetical protein